MLSSISIVLRDPPSDGELRLWVDKAIRTLDLATTGVFLVYEQAIERAPGVVVHIWWDPVFPDFDVRLVCDDVLQTRYISVAGPDPEQRRRVLEELARHFDVVPLEELREAARRSSAGNAWLRLALGIRKGFDEASFELIQEGLASSDVDQRHGAAQAAAMLQWPQLTEPLRSTLAHESDPETRRFLQIALASWRVS